MDMKLMNLIMFLAMSVIIALFSSPGSGAIDVPVPTGPPVIVQAEDCSITAVSGHYSTGQIDSTDVVYVATNASGDKKNGFGDIKFNFPNSVPDGEYTLRVRWHTGTMNASAWAFMIGADSGTVVEGSYYKSGKWHFYYPGHPNSHNDQWFIDDLAGPNGLRFKVWPNTKVLNYINVAGAGSGDFYVRFLDTATATNNYLALDYFELTPVTIQNKSYHFEAEDCSIISTKTFVQDYGVLIAYDQVQGHIYATGEGTFAFPGEMEDGDYIVKMAYYIWSWDSGAYSSFAIVSLGGASVVEHGVSSSGAWRTFWPNVSGHTYAVDELAGPDGMQWPHQTQADYVTISGVDPNEMAVKFWDQCSNTYNSFTLDYFEIIPVSGLE